MPTTIYDSSLITQRSRDKVIAQQIKQATDNGKPIIIPQAGYGSYLSGEVDNGNITYFRKVDGCTDIDLSCNCTGFTTVISSGSAPTPSGTYTVTYLGNSNTGGTAPTDGSSPYSSGTSVTILGNSGTLTRTGYQFAGWNTAADGSGTNYVGANTFTITQNTTLYANWIIGGVRLVYNGNGASNPTATPSSSGTYYTAFSTQPIVGNTGSFTNGSLVFGGWNTSADGSGTSYPDGSQYNMPGAGTVTLYAQWINPATTYTLTYDANSAAGGSGTAPTPTTSYSANTPVTILGNTGPFTNSDPNKVFYGWNTLANGTGTSFPPGSTMTMIANRTLYAQWGSTPLLTVTYDANGATGGTVPAAPTSYPSGVQVPILGQGSLTRPGYTFLGWNGSPTGIGSLYVPGYTFTSKTTTLYANWAPGSTVKNCGGGTTGGGSGATSIQYIFPYAQIIQSSDTITIYTIALLGTTTSNYGSGAAPLGIISISSKTVITQTTIQINVNTTYSNSANDYNYAKTITNGVDVTYWPSSTTISSITYSVLTLPTNSSIPTYSISTQASFNGCGLTANNIGTTTYSFFTQGLILNFSNSTNTIIATSPNNAFYTADSGTTWTNAPRTAYPYALVVPKSDNALTTITITPSSGSQYVSPSLPNYTIEYNGNGDTSGGVSLPYPQYMDPYVSGTTSITLRTNVGGGANGSLAKTGKTFSGWNTKADGTGTNYAAGATYTGGASLTLYAKWA